MDRVAYRLLLLASTLTAACGPADDTDDTGDDAPVTVEVPISAADGGTVTLGEATLVIPPGVLAVDTTITVTRSAVDDTIPDAETVVSDVYDFGPDGTTFLEPATLTLPFDTDDDNRVVTSYLVDEAWSDLPTGAAEGLAVSPLSHFTSLCTRIVGIRGEDSLLSGDYGGVQLGLVVDRGPDAQPAGYSLPITQARTGAKHGALEVGLDGSGNGTVAGPEVGVTHVWSPGRRGVTGTVLGSPGCSASVNSDVSQVPDPQFTVEGETDESSATFRYEVFADGSVQILPGEGTPFPAATGAGGTVLVMGNAQGKRIDTMVLIRRASSAPDFSGTWRWATFQSHLGRGGYGWSTGSGTLVASGNSFTGDASNDQFFRPLTIESVQATAHFDLPCPDRPYPQQLAVQIPTTQAAPEHTSQTGAIAGTYAVGSDGTLTLTAEKPLAGQVSADGGFAVLGASESDPPNSGQAQILVLVKAPTAAGPGLLDGAYNLFGIAGCMPGSDRIRMHSARLEFDGANSVSVSGQSFVQAERLWGTTPGSTLLTFDTGLEASLDGVPADQFSMNVQVGGPPDMSLGYAVTADGAVTLLSGTTVLLSGFTSPDGGVLVFPRADDECVGLEIGLRAP